MNVYLLVAEDKAVAHSVSTVIQETDLALVERNVDQAARRLVSLQVDAIILDDAPALGLDAVKALKAAAPATPLLVLSGRGDLLTQAAFTRAGADGIIMKPFSCESLMSALEGATLLRVQVTPAPYVQAAPLARSGTLGQYQMALRWISRAGAYAADQHRLAQSLVEALVDIFDTVRCAVLLEGGDGVRIAAGYGLDSSVADGMRLGYTSGIMRLFDERGALIDRSMAYDVPDAAKQMQLLGVRLAAPLFRNGRVFGALAVGERASGQELSAEEYDLLTLIARAASISLGQAHAQAAAVESQVRLASAVEHVPVGIVTVTPDKRITLMNPAAEAALELRASDVLGASIQRLGSGFADVVLRTLKEGQQRTAEVRDAATGRHFRVHAVPSNGQGVTLSFERAEEVRAGEDVMESPFWEYLSSRVAQEIKNPMVAINTFAQLLPRKYDSVDFRDAFSRVVQKEVDRINGVVETLFSFARNPRLSVAKGDLNQTVREVLKTFESELAANAIRLETDLDPNAADAEFDQKYLTRAMQHVVQNSIEAMPQGGRLSIQTRPGKEEAEIVIQDSGPGVAPQDEKLIFLPFYSTKERGMGLGLPLAGRIMQQHHGELRHVPDAGPGTQFVFKLPRKGLAHANHTDD